jgi:hypothetical protein
MSDQPPVTLANLPEAQSHAQLLAKSLTLNPYTRPAQGGATTPSVDLVTGDPRVSTAPKMPTPPPPRRW